MVDYFVVNLLSSVNFLPVPTTSVQQHWVASMAKYFIVVELFPTRHLLVPPTFGQLHYVGMANFIITELSSSYPPPALITFSIQILWQSLVISVLVLTAFELFPF